MTASKRLDSRWWDLAGVLGAILVGAVAAALLLGSQRADVLFFGADSTVMPVVQRGIERGDPFDWRMTSTIFAVEIPIYALISVFVKSSITQVLVSGIVNYVFLYAMLRWIAVTVMPAWHRVGRVTVSLMAAAVPAVLVALEVTRSVRTIELASMLLATSYYYPVLIGMLMAVALGARMVRIGDTASPAFRWHACALGVATAVLVLSNPLFAGWAVAPVSLTLVALSWRRGLPRRLTVVAIGAMGAGVVAALVGRELLGDVVGRDASKYLGNALAAANYYYRETLIGSASTWRGVVELIVVALLLALSVYTARRALRERPAIEVQFTALAPPIIVAVVFLGSLAAGAGAARYVQPVLFAPLISLLVLAQLWRARAADVAPGGTETGPWPQRLTAVFAVALLLGGAVSVAQVASYSKTARYTAADCLDNWLDGRPLTGAGGFWMVRPMAAFGPESLQLVQMEPLVTPNLWMTNSHDYAQDREITFAVVEQNSWYPTMEGKPSTQAQDYQEWLGAPREVISCDADNYSIFDYAGTEGAEIMTRQLSAARK